MNYLYVCNWKMFMNHRLIDSFLKAYALEASGIFEYGEVVICPPFSFLDYANTQKRIGAIDTLKLGAQDCSQFSYGAYTGEIAASYLQEAGCQYCIVGHAERRNLFYEDDRIVLTKIKNLLANGITPIICIGSIRGELSMVDECTCVIKQINFFMSNLDVNSNLIFAYEPHQAIGADTRPTIDSIKEIFSTIKTAICNFLFKKKPLIMYGGSVDENSIQILKKIDEIDGFLIGRASIDFQKLKNIISY
jgi:triosephosphate isomerase (TIM)